MKLTHWKSTIVDISVYDEQICRQNLSVLANAVNVANAELLKKLTPGDKVLEIGCGVDSYLLSNLPDDVEWEGVDVFEKDSLGRKTLATKLASVHSLPYENATFDKVLSNQSMEHWFEYGVSLDDGLNEICRVLKPGGRAYINVPIHLHGNKHFVRGDFDSIETAIDDRRWSISEKVAYLDESAPQYEGWLHCGFPSFYIRRNPLSESTSYVAEYILEKTTNECDECPDMPLDRVLELLPRKSLTMRMAHHGLDILAWKFLRKITKKLPAWGLGGSRSLETR